MQDLKNLSGLKKWFVWLIDVQKVLKVNES
jgi:hypothetical protein